MNVKSKLFVMVAAVLGFVLGIASTQPADADTFSYTVWNYPGGPTAILNCGWHIECTYGTDGDSLDWLSAYTSPIYWRSYATNDQSITVTGSILVIDLSSGSCNTTYARLRSPLGTDLGSIKYLHTSPYGAGSAYYVYSGFFPASTEVRVGTTVQNDCGAYPAHLHQGYASTNWARNNVYPTRGNCTLDACETYSSVWEYYQHERVWYSGGY